MSDVVLRVENLWKQYRLGVIGVNTIRDDLRRLWAKLRGKEDPLLKIGETNDRENIQGEYVWALQDINFEVKRGEVVGIIGKNGAGKSTLLKILSKVTTPTRGRVYTKGRVSSLLEVGTGFHPELTGRENVFLNGAILGMTKSEIRKKFDEIVEFSGVGKYIDTPVKRYSSGMYVRLAFAVAAHLDPEILIVDEVLAVGDAEFQKKCLGKMKEVSCEGRTVLFVSHNMDVIQTICLKGIYLRNGRIAHIGNVADSIQLYLSKDCKHVSYLKWDDDKPGDEVAKLNYARLIDENMNNITYVKLGQRFGIEYEYEIYKVGYAPVPNIHVLTIKDQYVFVASEKISEKQKKVGRHKVIAWFPSNLLNAGSYKVHIALSTLYPFVQVHFNVQEALVFDVLEDINERGHNYIHAVPGVVRPILEWQREETVPSL